MDQSDEKAAPHGSRRVEYARAAEEGMRMAKAEMAATNAKSERLRALRAARDAEAPPAIKLKRKRRGAAGAA